MSRTWEELLETQCYLVNMDKSPERLHISLTRISKAGFTNIKRWKAVDGENEEELKTEWNKYGNPKLRTDDKFNINKGKQACALSHYGIWKDMIDKNIKIAIVFEDDVLFHKDWNILARQYYELTPKTYDLLYMGSSFDERIPRPVISVPVFCTHAYVITLESAKRCYDICLKDEIGTYTIDRMLREKMISKTLGIEWYVWNGLICLDPIAVRSPKWQDRLKNSGLVFQDDEFQSYIGQE